MPRERLSGFEPPTEVVNDVSVSFTMVRSDSAEGPGQTVAYTHTLSETEGELITSRLVDDTSHKRMGRVALLPDNGVASAT
jgi:hypothetical protein